MIWLLPRLLTALAVAAVAALIGLLAATLLQLPGARVYAVERFVGCLG